MKKEPTSKLDCRDLSIVGDGSHIIKIRNMILSNLCKEFDKEMMEELNNDIERKENNNGSIE